MKIECKEGVEMDIRQLRYFHTIVEEGQISLAAKKLNMTQPPLSQQLKSLEEELGTSLIVRTRKTIELTEAGKKLYERADQLLKQVDDIAQEVREIGEGISGTLAIGMAKSCMYAMPELIRRFHQQYTNVTIKIWEGDPSRLSEYLATRDIELAIVRPPIDKTDREIVELQHEPFVFFIHDSWELPQKNTISIHEITRFPLIALHRAHGTGMYEMILEEFSRHGLTPNYICESTDVSIILSLVNAGVGGTVLPRSALYSYPAEHLRVLEIEDFSLQSVMLLVWLKDKYISKAAQRFIQFYSCLSEKDLWSEAGSQEMDEGRN